MQIVEQVNITMSNVPSSLAKVGDRLRSSDINIDAISCTESPTNTVIHLIVSDPESAKIILKELGHVTATEVIAMKVKNRTGIIADIGRACAATGVNIHYIYSTTCGKEAMVYVSAEDPVRALGQLQKWEKSAGRL